MLAARTASGKVVLADKAIPFAPHSCCDCGGAVDVVPGTLRNEFRHQSGDCGSGKWLHDFAIQLIADSEVGSHILGPGGLLQIQSAPVVEQAIGGRCLKVMSRERRPDIGMKARQRLDRYGGHYYGATGRLVIEVTRTSGKNREFVDDMKAIGVSAVEFDLGAMATDGHFHDYKGDLIDRVVKWLKGSQRHKRWLWAGPEFREANRKWQRNMRYAEVA